jgi:hypothetical protein
MRVICSRDVRGRRAAPAALLGAPALSLAGGAVAPAASTSCNTLPPREARTWNGYNVVYHGRGGNDVVEGHAGNGPRACVSRRGCRRGG